MILYKYLPYNRIDVLSRLKIRFTQPVVWNDPFESRPHIEYDFTQEDMRKVMEIEFERAQMPEPERESVRNRFENGGFDKHWPEILNMIIELMASTSPALSLTEKYDNLLMWAHYASNHEGFVVGFNTSHPFFKREGKGIHTLNKVVYTTIRPNVGISELTLADSHLTKSIDWQYEEEWRLFVEMDKASEIIKAEYYPVCLFDLPPDAIKEVIVGFRADDNFKDSILSILTSNPSLRHVILKQATISDKEYKLLIKECPSFG